MQRSQFPIHNGSLESFANQVWIGYQFFKFEIALLKFVPHFYAGKLYEWSELNQQKWQYFKNVWLPKGCESGIAILWWRVTWNYAYSPINTGAMTD